MKSKLKLSAVILLFIAWSLADSWAQFGGAPQTFNPATGMPGGPAPQTFDPNTGLPITSSAPEWKDANWKDPDITLTNVVFDGLPLSEVSRWLSQQFKEQFDALLPDAAGGIAYMNNQTVPMGWQHDWRSEPVNLRLKNVTASEIFSAMNLLFENNRTPLRWELKINGHRQIALLRVLIEPSPQVDLTAPVPGQEKQRRVYFVGNLIGDEKSGGMTMERIIKTVTDVWQMADASGGRIQFHNDAQLLVVSGTPGQIDFMEQTLKALEQRVVQQKSDQAEKSFTPKAAEQKANREKTNSGAPGR
jgi:hypothetical protein